MNIGLILFILFAFLATFSLGYLFITNRKAIKTKAELNKLFFIKDGIVILTFGLTFTAMLLSIYKWNNINATAGDYMSTIFGGIFFGIFFGASLSAFMLHYYGKPENQKLDKWLYRLLAICFPLSLVFMFVTTNGFADYLKYPLVNGINFSHGWVTPENGSPNLAFYALCILSGAIYVYLLCDHKFYKEYGKHGILESTFIVAFPAGIIGARLFYVIGNWEKEFANADNPFLAAINMTNGGLTILGGAIMGIVVGVLWFLWRNKKYNIWLAVDIIVPTILIAQGIGRWGNFFNCEVHGGEVPEQYWRWLPKVVFNNAHYSDTQHWAHDGYLFAPLFFIEGIINFLGYFVLAHLFGNKLRKCTELGDCAFGYLIWYGSTRAMMEPLRHSAYNMGNDGYWSWFWSLVFVVGGAILIVGNHLIRYLLKKKRGALHAKENWKNHGRIATIIILASSLVFMMIGVFKMLNNPFTKEIGFNQFNIGLIFVIYGVTVLMGLGISIPYTIAGKNVKKVEIENE